ncbi:hypothetical protein RY831_14175 [Noviherbaspirillum sp. CPCC 100848]|uniref:VCBS repeat-containing protein n=1 Tax=Noviherbaspirillum album TaxID=3080276 RepID=A0ABU6J9I3_9BURK|nr:hypothetical protein [Noviherbaspirillum sp. CPCC 100848]MEC4720304.1 hypothetical protein [Noviherbaspirillum sp. CPCC 100848]
MIAFQSRLILVLFTLALAAEATAQTRRPMPERVFNRHAFAGLVHDIPAAHYASARLDYELEGVSGAIHFSNCQQVENTSSASIVEPQYALFRLLAINCLALKRHAQGLPATRSYFPPQLSESLVSVFPATATVNIGGHSESVTGTSLRHNRKGWRASRAAHGGIKIATDEDERTYIIMSRADFDQDGSEDLLIRVDWAARHGSGRGFDLVQLSRTSKNGPIHVSWRAP